MRALCTIPLFAMEKTPLQELTENIQLSTTTADVSGQSAIQEKINAELKQQLNASQDVDQSKKLSEENETLKRHLANLQLTYEGIKTIVDDWNRNEVALRQTFITPEESVTKNEQKYESGFAQVSKCIQKIVQWREDEVHMLEDKNNMLSAHIKRLEITNASLKESLDRKIKNAVHLSPCVIGYLP